MNRDNDLEGKIFAVTGGASGMGLATSQILLSRGAHVAIGDINDTALDAARKNLKSSGKVTFSRVDVTKRSDVDSWIASVVEKHGKLSGAANCAGVIGKHHGTRTIEEQDDEQWHMIMSTL